MAVVRKILGQHLRQIQTISNVEEIMEWLEEEKAVVLEEYAKKYEQEKNTTLYCELAFMSNTGFIFISWEKFMPGKRSIGYSEYEKLKIITLTSGSRWRENNPDKFWTLVDKFLRTGKF